MRFARNLVFGVVFGGLAVTASAVTIIDFQGLTVSPNLIELTVPASVAPGVTVGNAYIFANSSPESTNHEKAIQIPFSENGATTLSGSVLTFSNLSVSSFSFRYSSLFDTHLSMTYSDSTKSANGIAGATFSSDAGSTLPFCVASSLFCSWKDSEIFSAPAGLSIASIQFANGDFSQGDGKPGGRISELQIYPSIPEPATYLLMVLGLTGIGFVARRQTTCSVTRLGG